MRNFFLLFSIPFLSFSQSPKEETQLLIEDKKYEAAQTVISNYLKTHTTDTEAIELLGDVYGFQEKWDKAITQYKALVETNAEDANYQYKYGGALAMKALTVNKLKAIGIISDVKKAFNKAAELDENHIEVRWAMVELYMALPGIIGGSKKKSLKYANELQNISKLDGYLAKGYVYEYDDEPELAEKYFKLAAKVSDNINCENNNANQRNDLYYQMGKLSADYKLQLDKGEKCLHLYLQNHSAKDGVPKAWAYYRLAQIFKHHNNNAEALKWVDKAIKALPEVEVFQEFKLSIQ